MKFTILFATAACLFAIAAAVELTIYSDRSCNTKSTSFSPNPLVATINQCFAFPGGGGLAYMKFTACGAQATASFYSDSTCSTPVGAPASQNVDVCIVSSDPTEGSSKVSCGVPDPKTCKGSPQYCSNCGDCLSIIRTSDGKQTYYWVASDPNADPVDRNTAGTCVERFDPPTTGSLRPANSKDLCGKKVFTDCSSSLTRSISQSCPAVSAGSALQASTTVTASLVAAFAVYLIFN